MAVFNDQQCIQAGDILYLLGCALQREISLKIMFLKFVSEILYYALNITRGFEINHTMLKCYLGHPLLFSIKCISWVIGQMTKKVKKSHNNPENRRLETPASLTWSLETTRHGHQTDTNST